MRRELSAFFAYRDEKCARRDVRFAWVGRYTRARACRRTPELTRLALAPKCMRASPRQFLRGAISFVIYFAGGNSCFRNAIRAWPLPPRLARNASRTWKGAYGDDDDDYDGDENGSGDGGLEIAALIRIRWTNEIIRK